MARKTVPPPPEEAVKELTLPQAVIATQESGEPTGVHNRKSENFTSVYANNVAFNMNAFDMVLTFGRMQGMQNGILEVEQSVEVVMSPLQMKLMASVLIANLREYEQRFGKINIPYAAP